MSTENTGWDTIVYGCLTVLHNLWAEALTRLWLYFAPNYYLKYICIESNLGRSVSSSIAKGRHAYNLLENIQVL